MKNNSGERCINTLYKEVTLLLSDTNWDQKDIQNYSLHNLIEAKALLINVQEKLIQISERERFDELRPNK